MKKERKVYEAPELRVHQVMAQMTMLEGSNQGGFTPKEPDDSRSIILDDEEY